jgi:hypothetical protein
MTSVIIAQAINIIATLLIGQDVFPRLLGVVERWADKEISAAEKRHGVLAELEVIGLNLTESVARFGIELAVQYLKRVKA